MKKNYQLLVNHMNPNPHYLFGHAEIAGMLANGENHIPWFKEHLREMKNSEESYLLKLREQATNNNMYINSLKFNML